ncbi:hypothetical protein HMPREF0765_3238 [Sphingobacterium spiritivorum ATCC 33300]|uniref:Uncharacterized protein n=1 Tax=Sphingobacterium spiritivorum ATCC 33300 TaxID=525372 RepID=C2G0Y2_SPHSI|nr:hypothetical protein HMPREF0765_3238 [Sphingobacterium spiritivorum ATCC 33300]
MGTATKLKQTDKRKSYFFYLTISELALSRCFSKIGAVSLIRWPINQFIIANFTIERD